MSEPGSAQVIGAWVQERAQVDLLFGQGSIGFSFFTAKEKFGYHGEAVLQGERRSLFRITERTVAVLRRCFPSGSLRFLALCQPRRARRRQGYKQQTQG